MATYEYLCLACEQPFEETRPMSSSPINTALACPTCGSDRIRRRFSFSAATGNAGTGSIGAGCCGGGCACGN
jgi:putative FmdB family regulatory protein